MKRSRWTPDLINVFLGTLSQGENYPPYDRKFLTFAYGRRGGIDEIRNLWRQTLRAMQAGLAPRLVGLYIHWPFCISKCSYCFCDSYVPSSYEDIRLYLRALKDEAEAFRDVFSGVSFGSVCFGGGTPSFVSAADLDGLLTHLRSCFIFAPSAQIHIEVSPATLDKSKLEVFRRHGVNRVTVGVQSTDDRVLAATERKGQSAGRVEETCRMLLDAGGIVVDVDLMAGLEGQTSSSFVRDLARIIRIGPHMVHVYGFDPRSHTIFSRSGKTLAEEDHRKIRVLLELSDRIMGLNGYRRASPNSEDPERECIEDRQNVSIRKCSASILGLGNAAISHAFGKAWYQHLPIGSGPVRSSRIPSFRIVDSNVEEERRGYAIRNLGLYGGFSRRDFRSLFLKDVMSASGLNRDLRALEARGHVTIDADAVRLKALGPAERLTALKSLYSREVVRRILGTHRKERAAFILEYAEADDLRLQNLCEQMANKFVSRAYFKTSLLSRSRR